MKLHVITVPLTGPDGPATLEALQATHDIARYDHYLVDLADGPAVAIVAAVRDRPRGPNRPPKKARQTAEKLLAELSPDARDRFERLRAWRRMTARDEGIPVYALATNAQLAEMARLDRPSKSKLGDINGFGKRKIERHAGAILDLLSSPGYASTEQTQVEEVSDE